MRPATEPKRYKDCTAKGRDYLWAFVRPCDQVAERLQGQWRSEPGASLARPC